MAEDPKNSSEGLSEAPEQRFSEEQLEGFEPGEASTPAKTDSHRSPRRK
jgi:hypothetical protein